ncbi:MAG: hypothetical protein M3492_07640 [Actinomycetota bacterium]|nr:hypothetical protein [Actinomycetota bacterium]
MLTLLRRAASAVDAGDEELTGTWNVVPKAAIRLSTSAMTVRRDLMIVTSSFCYH